MGLFIFCLIFTLKSILYVYNNLLLITYGIYHFCKNRIIYFTRMTHRSWKRYIKEKWCRAIRWTEDFFYHFTTMKSISDIRFLHEVLILRLFYVFLRFGVRFNVLCVFVLQKRWDRSHERIFSYYQFYNLSCDMTLT